MRGRVHAIVHCFTVVTVTLLSLSTMETGNGQDTLHIIDGGSYWLADILVSCLMFLLAAWYFPHPPLWSTASRLDLQQQGGCSYVLVIRSYTIFSRYI